MKKRTAEYNDTFTPDAHVHNRLKGTVTLIKIGGNALTDETVKNGIAGQIAYLWKMGIKLVLVHGGGIEIKQLLDQVELVSEFVGGHRKTDKKAMGYIEMALSGSVNKELVSLLAGHGVDAVGISGKDASTVTAARRVHSIPSDNGEQQIDLGFVGDVSAVNPALIQTLLEKNYLPVISPVSIGPDGETYNINADMFAGHVAGALNAQKFIALTNINGLLQDIDKPESIIYNLTPEKARALFGTVIQGGMIPKIEACLIALQNGVESTHIINGTNREELLRILLTKDKLGTTIAH